MNYLMAFIIGLTINLALFKLRLAWMEYQAPARVLHYKRIFFDALIWGLVTLVTYDAYHFTHEAFVLIAKNG